MNTNLFNKFLYWLTSTDIDIINKCSRAERRHRLTLGLAMLIPMLLGFEAGYYAGGVISNENSSVMLLIGTTFFLLVMLLEKSVTAGISGTKFSSAVKTRIALGLIWASLLSPIIAISWFSDAIDAQLYKKVENIRASVNDKFEKSKTAENDQLTNLATEVESARQAMVAEADGSGGSGYRNMGPIYQMKKQLYEEKKQEYESAQLKTNEKLIELMQKRDAELQSCTAEVAAGVLGRVNTLFEIASSNWYISFQLLCTFLFLFSIEIIAIMAKLDYNSKEENVYNKLVSRTSEDIISREERVRLSRREVQLFPEIITLQKRRHEHELESLKYNSEQEVNEIKIKGDKLLLLIRQRACFESELRNIVADDVVSYQDIMAVYNKMSGLKTEQPTHTPFQYDGPIANEWEENIAEPFSVSNSIIDTCKTIHDNLSAKADDNEKALAIYNWIHQNITYSKEHFDGQLTALECYNTRTGVCIAMSCLFVAMGRVMGLTDTTIFGVDVDVKGEIVEHACAGFWNGNRQVLVDVSYHNADCSHQLYHTWDESRVKQYFQDIRFNKAA